MPKPKFSREHVHDVVYTALTEIDYSASETPKIEWRREGDNAFAKFGSLDNAKHFVLGFMNFWEGFKPKGSKALIPLRTSMIRNPPLGQKSMSNMVEFPQQYDATSVEIKIPLSAVSPLGVSGILDRQPSQNRVASTYLALFQLKNLAEKPWQTDMGVAAQEMTTQFGREASHRPFLLELAHTGLDTAQREMQYAHEQGVSIKKDKRRLKRLQRLYGRMLASVNRQATAG